MMLHRIVSVFSATAVLSFALLVTMVAVAPISCAEEVEARRQQQLDPEAPRDEIELWNQIERAGGAGEWQVVERLVQELAGWRSSRAVERVLSHVPHEKPEMQGIRRPSSLEQGREEARLEAARERALFEQVISQQNTGPDSGDESPSHSTMGRAARARADLRPPSHTATEMTPDAVLTVGAGCAYGTIQAAVNAAATSGDSLWIHGAVFNESVNINGKSLTIWGGLDSSCSYLDGSRTVVDGSGFPGTVLEIVGATPVVVEINLLDFTGGTDDVDYGGGIEVSDAAHEIHLNGVDIYDNQAYFGGGVHMSSGAVVFIGEGTRIAGNSATSNGGGLFLVGANTTAYVDSSVIGSSTLGGNSAYRGGGVYLGGSRLVLGVADAQAAVQFNAANRGGGVYASGFASITLYGAQSVISSNTAGGYGGGVYMTGDSSFSSHSGGVVDNSANYDGGGIYSSSFGSIDADSSFCNASMCSRFIGNQCIGGYGGAFSSYGEARIQLQSTYIHDNLAERYSSAFSAVGSASLSLRSVMITENHSHYGDGVMIVDSPSMAEMESCTIANNTGNQGDQLINLYWGDFVTRGLIVWGNDGAFLSSGYGGGLSISESIDQYEVGGPAVDPLFLDQDNGDYHIDAFSPAVDIATGGHGIDIDLDSRPIGDGWDAGADEANPRVGLNGAPCGFTKVSRAIAAASPGDTVYLSPGAYLERLGLIDKAIVLTAAVPDCTAEDPSADPSATVIDGSGEAPAFAGGVMELFGDVTVELRRLTLAGGTASYGGNLWVSADGTVTLHSAHLIGGVAEVTGGGARVYGTLNLYGESVIAANSADSADDSAYGGGVSVIGPTASLNLHDGSSIGSATLGANLSDTDGGGVWIGSGGAMTMSGSSTVTQNGMTGDSASDDGGGIFITGAGSSLVVGAGALINENVGWDDGGGIAAEDGATVLIDGGGVTSNTLVAHGEYSAGAGIYVQNAINNPVSVAIVNRGVVESNISDNSGGGLWVQEATEATTITLNGAELLFNQASNDVGGAVVLHGGTMTVDNSVISDNSATGAGGIINWGGVLVIEAVAGPVEISRNQAWGIYGGGVTDASGGVLRVWAQDGFPITVDSNFTTDSGGGISVVATGDLDLRGDVRVTNNEALEGGGIFHINGEGYIGEGGGARPLIAGNLADLGGGVCLISVEDADGDYLSGVVIDGNTTTPMGVGGGVYILHSSVVLENCLIQNNHTDRYGGGIFVADSSEVTITAEHVPPTPASASAAGASPGSSCDPSTLAADEYCSMLRNNTAGEEGGAVASLLAASSINISYTAILGNQAPQGAAINAGSAGDSFSLTNCRLTDNPGPTAVSLPFDVNLALDSCTIAGNGVEAVLIGSAASSITFDSNIVWGNAGGVSNPNGASIGGNGCNIDQAGVAGIVADPLFASTSRGAYHLGAGSPAIDACSTGPTADLDNVARPAGAGFDMGAFEVHDTSIYGVINLQPVRTSIAGVSVEAFEAGTSTLVASTTTAADGSFALDVPAGSYDVAADLDLYLSAIFAGASVAEGENLALPNVTLRGGDTDDNGIVALVDVTFVTSRFGSTAEPQADINNSGTVDIVDVSATVANYNTSQPTPWP